MRLKKLELYGFKSFAQRTEIIFTGGITGIVGPNGSGKSNIGDAVRWVLGEQSAKTLRGTSMADVIFGGTQKRKALSYCEVTLTFENDDHVLKAEYDEIAVTRRVYRSGEGEYYINKAAVRLKDVIDLFRDTGIGREGYSIIGQGRIDEILSRKSEDRRTVFEEAAGIVKFRARKEEADRKLARTLENEERLDDILSELEKRLGPLEKQSKAAKEYLELMGEMKGLDLTLFILRSDKLNTRVSELEESIHAVNDALEQTEQALQLCGEKREQVQEKIALLDEQLMKSRDILQELAGQIAECQRTQAGEQAAIAGAKTTLEHLQGEETASGEALANLEIRLKENADKREAGQAMLSQAEAALSDAKKDQEIAREDEIRAEILLENHKNEVLERINRRSALMNDQTRLHTMRENMESRLGDLLAEQEQNEQDRAKLETLEAESAARLQEARDAEKAAQGSIAAAQENLRQANAACQAAAARRNDLETQLNETASRHRIISEMSREMEGYNQSVRRAVAYAKSRNMNGVHGVLAQLIHVERKYETALDMALGAAMQNIVTDTEETAKGLIEYLRTNRFGRATFLPISAIRSKTLNAREREVLRMQGICGVASDLISYDEQYRPIVENLLGRTVISDNLTNGIAAQKFTGHSLKLVTLEGDVMHSGGSMTGGSVQSRGTSLLSREREVQELAEKIRQLKSDAAKAKQAEEDAGQTRDSAIGQLEKARLAQHECEIAVVRENEKHLSAMVDLDGHMQRMADTDEACAQLREAMADMDEQLASLAAGGADEEADAQMEEKTRQLTESLSEKRTCKEKADAQAVAAALDESDKRHALEDILREIARAEEEKRRLQFRGQERESTIRTLQTELGEATERESEAAQLLERLTLLQTQQSDHALCCEQTRSTHQQTLGQLMRENEALHENKMNDADRLHKLELQLNRAQSDLRTMQDRIWNTYELTYAGAQEFFIRENFNAPEAERRVHVLQGKIRALGHVNVAAVEEYAEEKARYEEMTSQLTDLRKAEKDLRALIEQLLSQMQVTFVESFEKLQGYFSETFTRLFGGGSAYLRLTDPAHPLDCGIEVGAQPPGKKLQHLSLLSGGERALTAIAILFAMLKLKPTPFCILDEIEAALDDANIGYYADYLKEYSKGTQFIVITHRKGTMERCDALYGVAMEEQGVSRMVSVALQDYEGD